MIAFLIYILGFGLLVLFLLPSKQLYLIRFVSLVCSYFAFFFSLILWVLFDSSSAKLQFCTEFIWFSYDNLNLVLGVDGISLFFILLTTLLVPTCLLSCWVNVQDFVKEFFLTLILLELLLILVFSVSDLLLFYVFFEGVLIPMFLLIGFWGTRERKIRAAYMFFLYTLFGSVVLLVAIVYIYLIVGTLNYEVLLSHSFSLIEQQFLWLSFFASFSTKIPMLPVHIWLPEAHVEAPTCGSVILAGILLKLGSYGFLRFSLPLFPEASVFYAPLILSLSILGVIYASFTAIRQTDLKRSIAYTSVAHMNLIVMGIFSFTLISVEGSIFQSISHGFVSSALFFLVGIVYDRYHTRAIKYYGGLVYLMPMFASLFFICSMANIALPGTSNFVGEFLILVGICETNLNAAFLGSLGMLIGGPYSLWVFNRVAFGNLKIQYMRGFADLNKREFFLFLPLVSGIFCLGIFSELILIPLHCGAAAVVEIASFGYY
ncbi:MAG: NADH-quinone oxidoreductase subunit M [Bacteroidota bacterium]